MVYDIFEEIVPSVTYTVVFRKIGNENDIYILFLQCSKYVGSEILEKNKYYSVLHIYIQ